MVANWKHESRRVRLKSYSYMVRYGESSKTEGTERTRFNGKRLQVSERIGKILQKEEIIYLFRVLINVPF